MEHGRSVQLVGTTLCLVLLLVLLAPYVFVHPLAVGVYYGSGVLDAYTVGVIALVATVAFLLDPTEKADLVVAGATVFLGGFLLVVSGLWAATVPPAVVMELSRVDELAYHRWALVALAVLILLVSAWNATIKGRRSG